MRPAVAGAPMAIGLIPAICTGVCLALDIASGCVLSASTHVCMRNIIQSTCFTHRYFPVLTILLCFCDVNFHPSVNTAAVIALPTSNVHALPYNPNNEF